MKPCKIVQTMLFHFSRIYKHGRQCLLVFQLVCRVLFLDLQQNRFCSRCGITIPLFATRRVCTYPLPFFPLSTCPESFLRAPSAATGGLFSAECAWRACGWCWPTWRVSSCAQRLGRIARSVVLGGLSGGYEPKTTELQWGWWLVFLELQTGNLRESRRILRVPAFVGWS